MFNIELIISELRTTYKKMVLSKVQAAKELGVSEATIDRMRRDGTIHSIRIGGQVMFRLDEVARVLVK